MELIYSLEWPCEVGIIIPPLTGEETEIQTCQPLR